MQYEGLQDICSTCGKYGHREKGCPLQKAKEPVGVEEPQRRSEEAEPTQYEGGAQSSTSKLVFGDWMVAHKNRWRPTRFATANHHTADFEVVTGLNGGDQRQRPGVTRSVAGVPRGSAMSSRFSVLDANEEVEAVHETTPTGVADVGGEKPASQDRRHGNTDEGCEQRRNSDSNVGSAEGGGARQVPQARRQGNTNVGREPSQSNGANVGTAEPNVQVSHSKLAEGLQRVGSSGWTISIVNDPVVVGSRQNKKKALHDITNKLGSRPTKMKNIRSWPQNGLGSLSRGKETQGIKQINEVWAAAEVIELMDTQATTEAIISSRPDWADGFTRDKPLDPTCSNKVDKNPLSPYCPRATSAERDYGAAEGAGGNNDFGEQDACMQEPHAAMDSGDSRAASSNS